MQHPACQRRSRVGLEQLQIQKGVEAPDKRDEVKNKAALKINKRC